MSRWLNSRDDHPWLAQALVAVYALLPPLNFITIHYGYFIAVSLVSSLVFWGSSNPSGSISYTDSLFLVVSAMTEAGLNTVNLSVLTTWQQTILFLLILAGSSIWVSIWTIVFRKHAFEQRFKDIVRADRERRMSRPPTPVPGLSRLRRFLLPQNPSGSPAFVARLAAPQTPGVEQGTEADSGPEKGMAVAPAYDTPSVPIGGEQDLATATAGTSSRITFADSANPVQGSANGTTTSSSYRSPDHLVRRSAAGADTKEHKQSSFGIQPFLTNRMVGRNAQFHDLTSEDREHLGGCEYRALKVLAIIVPLYFFLWQFLGCITLGAWINTYLPGPPLENGINPWWLGIFNGASAFNNSGMSLLDANMVPFQESTLVLIVMGLMILAGNTAYPIFLRLIVWTLLNALKWSTADETLHELKDTFKFILKYPRRVYTNLFPSRPTWWLLFMLIWLNSVDWVAFELLNLGNPTVEDIPTGPRILDGLFQALAVRSGGFYIVSIPSLYIGLQVLYVIMMYISVYPVVITMRHSNVYEERSLGIYSEDRPAIPDPEAGDETGSSPRRSSGRGTASALGRALQRSFTWHGVGARPVSDWGPAGDDHESRISFISQQVQGQLAHDLWWLVLAVWVITTIETSNWLADPVGYSVFNVIFEVVSAYGCVGISVGLANEAYSFSGGWHTASKLVLCAVMIRGRHRGLPVALDRAVRLPGEEMHRQEEEDHRIRRSMTSRRDDQG